MCDLAPVLAIHTAEYVNDLQLTLDTKLHAKLVFRFQKVVERELIIAQGTITGAQKSFDTKVSFNLQRYASCLYRSRRSFCLLNDQAIAAQFLLNHKLAKKSNHRFRRASRNGTAEIFQNNPNVFVFYAWQNQLSIQLLI
jgi:acetoin utilization deacetylase AcuC-like enzyme